MDGQNAKFSETAKWSVVITASILVAMIISILRRYEFIPFYITAILTPGIAYGICFALTLVIQQVSCGKFNLSGAALGTLGVAGSTGLASLILTLEQFQLLNIIEPYFGPFVPRNPVTGAAYTPDSVEYADAMETMNHKKIQYFSNIVKAVLPFSFSEATKDAFATFYWMFWMTLLPLFFSLSLTASC